MMAVHRLGGWLRLWIVLITIYAFAITVGAVSTATSREEIIAAWTQEILQTLAADARKATGEQITVIQLRAHKIFQNKSDEQIARELTQKAKDIDLTKPDMQISGQYKEDIASLAGKYEVRLETLPMEQAMHVGYAFLIWLFPSLSMLVLGYAVGWVVNGFKKI